MFPQGGRDKGSNPKGGVDRVLSADLIPVSHRIENFPLDQHFSIPTSTSSSARFS